MRRFSCYLIVVLIFLLPPTQGHAQELQAPTTKSVGVGVGIALESTIEESEISGVALAFGIVSLTSTVWNVWTIPSSIRRYNESLTAGPSIMPEGRVGLGLTYRW